MIRIVLLLTVFVSLADISAAFPRTPAFAKTVASKTVASSTTTPSSGSGVLSGIIPALAPAAPYVPIPFLLPDAVTPAAVPMGEGIEPSLGTAAPPTAKTPHEIATSAQPASSRRTSPSRMTISSTTRRSAESLKNKTTTSSSNTSSTTTTNLPITGSSAKTIIKSMTFPFGGAGKSPRTTISSPKTIRLTTRKDKTQLRKFAEMLEKDCDFDLLDAISEDLKDLWEKVTKDANEPMLGEMHDIQMFLKRILEQYNKCNEKNIHIDSDRQYEIYLKIFGKEYNATEKEMRKSVFKKNKEEVETHNELFKTGKASHKTSLNYYSDWTQEELDKMNGFRPTHTTTSGGPKRKARSVDGIIHKYYSDP